MLTTSSQCLYLIRHGETAWSISGQHTGHTDLPLTKQGEKQAETLSSRVKKIDFAHVLTSPLQRARQTCSLAGLESRALINTDLAEWDYGDYEGLRSSDIREQHAQWNIFRDGCPHGESAEQISQRADRFIASVRELRGNVALFSHGQFGMVLGARWIGLPVLNAQHFPLGTASLSILGYKQNHPDLPVIELWNSLSS